MKSVVDTLTPKQKSAIARAIQKPELRPILFRRATGLNWIDSFEEAGFLNPLDIPPPVPAKEEGYVSIPVWPITDYLVTASADLGEPGNDKYIQKVLDFLRTATVYAKTRGFGNYRVWWQFSKVLRNIPSEYVSLRDLEIIDYWLDDRYERGLVAESLGKHWLVRLLDKKDEHSKSIALVFLRLLYKPAFVDERSGTRDRKKAILRFDEYHAKEITRSTAAKAGELLGKEAVEIFRQNLEAVVTELENDKWSSLWRPAIDDHEQNLSARDAEDTLLEGARDSLLAFVRRSPHDATPYVKSLLEGNFQTTRRIAVFAIDRCYEQLQGLSPLVFSSDYFTNNFRHEFWHLLRNRYPQFSIDDRGKIRSLILGLRQTDADGSANEGATAYRQGLWLQAIKDYGAEELVLYQKCVSVAGAEPEHPDFASYTSSGWVSHESPIPKDSLLAMEIDDLVQQLLSYKDSGGFLEPGLEGLTKALKDVVKAAPIRYSGHLNKFVCLNLAYVYELLEAYGDLWLEKAQLPWDEIWQDLLAFCEELVRREAFWNKEVLEDRGSFVANKDWVVGSIGRLIENGTRSDEHAFSERHMDKALSVLKIILRRQKGSDFQEDDDAVSIAINSPRGRCLEALINFSLRACRLEKKRSGGHVESWKALEPIFNTELDRSNNGEYEFVTLVVNYLPNFIYMSKEWVFENLGRMFDRTNYQKWLCTMSAYAYVNIVYEEVYSFLKKEGHFINGLDDEKLNQRVVEKIVQNIVIAFINGFEELDRAGSLLAELLKRGRVEELSQLIWFVWTLRKKNDANLITAAFRLWPEVLRAINSLSMDGQNKGGRKLASRLATWAVFVERLDQNNMPLLLAVAEYAEEDYNAHEFLDMIARTSKSQPRESYEIWLKLLEGTGADFPEEAVRAALENFVISGAEGLRQAKSVASAYLKAGNERPAQWLKEIAARLAVN